MCVATQSVQGCKKIHALWSLTLSGLSLCLFAEPDLYLLVALMGPPFFCANIGNVIVIIYCEII